MTELAVLTAVIFIGLFVLDALILWVLQRHTRTFCRHTTVRVLRYHPLQVTDDMQGKQLYVDRCDVHNFIECCHCGQLLNTRQRDALLEEKKR